MQRKGLSLGQKEGIKGHIIEWTKAPPHLTTLTSVILFYDDEVVKYALCLIPVVRNANKKVSGASEAEKGSRPEEVKR